MILKLKIKSNFCANLLHEGRERHIAWKRYPKFALKFFYLIADVLSAILKSFLAERFDIYLRSDTNFT